MEEIDKYTEMNVINTYIPITDLLTKAKIDFREDSNFMCPFHPNQNTPSAHLYLDETDGGGKIWCYSEQKMYGSYDVITDYFPNTDTKKLALGIIQKFGLEEIEKTLGELELDNDIPFKKELEQFKNKKIDYSTLCKRIAEYYV